MNGLEKNRCRHLVFKRIDGRSYVLDSVSYLPSNVRQDFDAMQPKWFIEVEPV